MSAKSAANVASTTPAAKSRGRSVATRVADLESEVALLKSNLDRATRILVNLIESRAVQATLPAVEQQLRAGIKQQYAQGGLAALLGEQATPAP